MFNCQPNQLTSVLLVCLSNSSWIWEEARTQFFREVSSSLYEEFGYGGSGWSWSTSFVLLNIFFVAKLHFSLVVYTLLPNLFCSIPKKKRKICFVQDTSPRFKTWKCIGCVDFEIPTSIDCVAFILFIYLSFPGWFSFQCEISLFFFFFFWWIVWNIPVGMCSIWCCRTSPVVIY